MYVMFALGNVFVWYHETFKVVISLEQATVVAFRGHNKKKNIVKVLLTFHISS